MGFSVPNPSDPRFQNPFIDKIGSGATLKRSDIEKILRGRVAAANRGDYSNIPGLGQFDAQIASQKRDSLRNLNPLLIGNVGSFAVQRYMDTTNQGIENSVNQGRFGFIQDQLERDTRNLIGLQEGRKQRQLEAQSRQAGLFNDRFRIEKDSPGFFKQLLGGFAGRLGGSLF